MVSHWTLECFARGEEFVSGLMADQQQARILTPTSHCLRAGLRLICAAWFQQKWNSALWPDISILVLSVYKRSMMCSCAYNTSSHLSFLKCSREFLRFRTLTGPCWWLSFILWWICWDVHWEVGRKNVLICFLLNNFLPCEIMEFK